MNRPPESAAGASPVEKRMDLMGRTVFERAVSQAAEIATQNVAAIHRHRLVTQSFLAALFVFCAIGLPVVLFISDNIASTSRQNSLGNCRLVQRLEKPLGDFVSSDAALRAIQQKLSPSVQRSFQRLLGKSELARAEAQSRAANTATTNYWLHSVVPRLNKIAGANCLKRQH